jgi:uncharacterized protein YjbI with pentapeptide repeats
VSLDLAKLQGASLKNAALQGASLFGAMLQGADFKGAALQGASLDLAELQGATLQEAQLQGTSFKGADIDHSNFSGAWIWRARGDCTTARISYLKRDKVIYLTNPDDAKDKAGSALPVGIPDFLNAVVAGIPAALGRTEIAARIRQRLAIDSFNDDEILSEAWRRCEAESAKVSQEDFGIQLADVLRGVVCDAKHDAESIAKGFVLNWVSDDPGQRDFSKRLARGMLGEDGKGCAPAKNYDKATREQLRAVAGPPSAPARGSPRDGD